MTRSDYFGFADSLLLHVGILLSGLAVGNVQTKDGVEVTREQFKEYVREIIAEVMNEMDCTEEVVVVKSVPVQPPVEIGLYWMFIDYRNREDFSTVIKVAKLPDGNITYMSFHTVPKRNWNDFRRYFDADNTASFRFEQLKYDSKERSLLVPPRAKQNNERSSNVNRIYQGRA